MKKMAMFSCLLVVLAVCGGAMAQTPSEPSGGGGGSGGPGVTNVTGSFSVSDNNPGFNIWLNAQNTETTFTSDGNTWTVSAGNGGISANITQGAMGWYFRPVNHQISGSSYESGQASISFSLELLASRTPIDWWRNLPRGNKNGGLFGPPYSASSEASHGYDWYWDEKGEVWNTVPNNNINWFCSFWSQDTEVTSASLYPNMWTGDDGLTHMYLNGSFDLTYVGPVEYREAFSASFAEVTVPEPCTLAILAGGALALLKRRQRR